MRNEPRQPASQFLRVSGWHGSNPARQFLTSPRAAIVGIAHTVREIVAPGHPRSHSHVARPRLPVQTVSQPAMRDADITPVLRTIRGYIPRFHDQPSVGEVAERTHDPFLVLVSTLISLRTREEVTRAVMWKLFALAHTPAAMAALSPATIARTIAPATFAETKGRTIRDVAQRIATEHQGRVPDTLAGLIAFRGVGLKTANLVLALGFGKPAICVDIHVHRIFNRLGYVTTRTPDQTEAALRAKLPARYWIPVNNWLVTFGRNQCTPTRPKCSDCPVRAYCARVGVTTQR